MQQNGQRTLKNRRSDYTGIKKTCRQCHKEYEDVPERRLIYCSDKCFREAKKKVYICRHCGINYITTPTRNTVYCSRICMVKDKIGKIRPSWIGEKISRAKLKNGEPSEGRRIRKTAKYQKSRSASLNRDGFTCCICFNPGLDTHHIKTVKTHPELAYEVKNLITLCKNCHDKKVSKHEEDWEEYFNSILKDRT